MSKKKTDSFLVEVGGAHFDIESPASTRYAAEIQNSADVFDDDADNTAITLSGTHKYEYIPFGGDNELPYHIAGLVGEDEVMSQNKLFNVLTCYGAGLRYVDAKTKVNTTDSEIKKWMMSNALPRFFLEQATDMKYYFFSVSVIILSKDGTRVVKIRHKEACHCRFEKADRLGKINHVFYANWRKGGITEDNTEVIQLLDEYDPFGELNALMGRDCGPDGTKFVRTKARKFAILCRFPTVTCRYYPIPYYTSIFRGYWFDIKRLIGAGKRSKLRNHASIRYQVEVHKDYWRNLCNERGITDKLKMAEEIKAEKQRIKDFVSGHENSGKVWISGYYMDPNGKEQRMVRINLIDTTKEGGDWSDDIQEASNVTCYGDNIHPNLVGATPGKSQSNNSGSDKRELFTLKQSLEIAFHDIMAMPHLVCVHYNGWGEKVYPDVPMITLTTLDENADAKKKSAQTNDLEDTND